MCIRLTKKITALLLAVLLLALAAAPAYAAEGFTFNWDSGDERDSTEPHCKSLFMLNLDTDTVVYTLNPDEQLPPASMTKIMSYIVAYENIPDIENAQITVSQKVEDDLLGTESSLAGVSVGEQLTGYDLLNLMMVPSGNDAALVLMYYVDELYAAGRITPQNAPDPEDPAAPADTAATPPPTAQTEYGETIDYSESSYFVRMMNEKAKELGCKNTHFSNPHGLHKENHYTTARDMATITKYAMTLPNFSEITRQQRYEKPPTNMDPDGQTVFNTNKMLANHGDEYGNNYFYTYANGVKTGSHDQAGFCLTASANYSGYTYIVVAMGDMEGYAQNIHNEMRDAATLFRWAFTNLGKKTITTQGDVLSSVKLEYAYQKDELLLAADRNVSVMLPNSVDASSIIVTVDKPESVQAPVRKGEEIGTATLSYADEVVATVPLVTAESVARSDLIAGWEQGRSLLTAPWFIAVMAVIGGLIVVYLILVVFYKRKQRLLRRVRKFRDL